MKTLYTMFYASFKKHLWLFCALLWVATAQAKPVDPDIQRRITEGSQQLKAMIAQNAWNNAHGLSHRNRYVFGDTKWIKVENDAIDNAVALDKLLVQYNTGTDKQYTYHVVQAYVYIGGTRGLKVAPPPKDESPTDKIERIKNGLIRERYDETTFRKIRKIEAQVIEGIRKNVFGDLEQADNYNLILGITAYLDVIPPQIASKPNETVIVGFRRISLNKRLREKNNALKAVLYQLLTPHIKAVLNPRAPVNDPKAQRGKAMHKLVKTMLQQLGTCHPEKNPAEVNMSAEMPTALYTSTETYTADNCIYLKNKTNKKTQKATKGLTVIDYTGTLAGQSLNIVWKPDLYKARQGSSKLKIIVTNEATKHSHATDFKRLIKKQDEFGARQDEMVIWIHFNAQNRFEQRFWYDLNTQREIQQEIFIARMQQAQASFLKTSGQIIAGGTVGSLFVLKNTADLVTKLLTSLEIPKHWWNPRCVIKPKGKACNDCKDKYLALTAGLPLEAQLDFAFVAGLYNGLVDQVKGISQLVGLVVSYIVDAKTRNAIHSAVAKLKASDISKAIGKHAGKYTNCGEHYAAYQSGKDIVGILAMFVGLGEIKAAVKSGRFLESLVSITVNSMSNAAKKSVRIAYGIKNLGIQGIRVVRKTGTKLYQITVRGGTEVIALIENGVIKVRRWVDISNGKGKFLSKNLDESQAGVRIGETNTGKVGMCDNKGLCFAANTLVFTGNTFRNIEQINALDTVMAQSPQSCAQALKTVEATFIRTAYHITQLNFDQDTILATPLHPFFNLKNKEVLAGNLKIGDTLKTYDGYAIVRNTHTIDTTLTVYNFHVKDFHTYYVGKSKLWVHNMMSHQNYTTSIKWAIHDIPARPHGKGYFGKRIKQNDNRVDAYEQKINPNDESFYITKSDGKFVQFENIQGNTLQDGKLIKKTQSIYHTDDVPYGHNSILSEARRQLDAANTHGLDVEWLVSDQKALNQLTTFFKNNNINIKITHLPE